MEHSLVIGDCIRIRSFGTVDWKPIERFKKIGRFEKIGCLAVAGWLTAGYLMSCFCLIGCSVEWITVAVKLTCFSILKQRRSRNLS